MFRFHVKPQECTVEYGYLEVFMRKSWGQKQSKKKDTETQNVVYKHSTVVA